MKTLTGLIKETKNPKKNGSVKSMQHLILEASQFEDSEAAAQAKKMGLTHKGFGQYADKTGKVTHKSVGGKLTPVKSSGAGSAPGTNAKPSPTGTINYPSKGDASFDPEREKRYQQSKAAAGVPPSEPSSSNYTSPEQEKYWADREKGKNPHVPEMDPNYGEPEPDAPKTILDVPVDPATGKFKAGKYPFSKFTDTDGETHDLSLEIPDNAGDYVKSEIRKFSKMNSSPESQKSVNQFDLSDPGEHMVPRNALASALDKFKSKFGDAQLKSAHWSSDGKRTKRPEGQRNYLKAEVQAGNETFSGYYDAWDKMFKFSKKNAKASTSKPGAQKNPKLEKRLDRLDNVLSNAALNSDDYKVNDDGSIDYVQGDDDRGEYDAGRGEEILAKLGAKKIKTADGKWAIKIPASGKAISGVQKAVDADWKKGMRGEN